MKCLFCKKRIWFWQQRIFYSALFSLIPPDQGMPELPGNDAYHTKCFDSTPAGKRINFMESWRRDCIENSPRR